MERCLRYSDLKKFMVCDCVMLAAGLFQTSGALLVNESMPGREGFFFEFDSFSLLKFLFLVRN